MRRERGWEEEGLGGRGVEEEEGLGGRGVEEGEGLRRETSQYASVVYSKLCTLQLPHFELGYFSGSLKKVGFEIIELSI